MAKYKVNAFPRKPYVHEPSKSWAITELKREGGCLVLVPGETVEMTDQEYRSCFHAPEGQQEPLYPTCLITRLVEASAAPAPQKPLQAEAPKADPKADAKAQWKSGDKEKQAKK